MQKNKLKLYKEFDPTIADIIYNKYIWKDKEGNPIDKSYEDIVNRIIEKVKQYPKIMPPKMIKDLRTSLYNMKIIPGGGILTGMGTDKLTSLSNCFVIDSAKDNYESIIGNDAAQTHIMKRRGGVGHDLSNIRPKGSIVNNAAETSTGIVPFMERYSNTTNEVAQGGRRGALMLTLDEKHSDALDFVNAKKDMTSITGANISLKSTKWLFKQKKLFDSVIHNMYHYAEPGLLFWDNILDNPIDAMKLEEFKTISTNPCGEIPLNAFGSCLLTHLNLYSYVKNPFTNKAEIDWYELKKDTELGIRFLNVIVEEELKHIIRILGVCEDGIETKTWNRIHAVLSRGRRIALGKTGLADMLAALELNYDNSKETLKIIEQVSKSIKEAAYKTSCIIPIIAPILEDDNNYTKFVKHPFYNKASESLGKKKGLLKPANIGLLTVAPVGTGSIIAEVTSGIEPLFNHCYNRKRRAHEGEEYNTLINKEKWIQKQYIHKPLLDFAIYNGLFSNSNVQDIEDIFKKSPYFLNTTKDIDVMHKIDIQSVLQKYTDQSISVTHNIPEDYDITLIPDLIKYAQKKKLKGFTVYREGSREGILTISKDTFKMPDKRPKELDCDIHSVKANGEDWTIIIGLFKKKPYEMFALKVNNVVLKKISNAKLVKNKEKIKEEFVTKYKLISDYITINDLTSLYSSGNEEVLTRMISRRWRNGETASDILNDFDKVQMTIGTFEQVVKRILCYYVNKKVTTDPCPNCLSMLILENGCKTCKSCGYEKCG